jgi:hypothetical protein
MAIDSVLWKQLQEQNLLRLTFGGLRTPTTRGRSQEAGVNLNQLRTVMGRQLRVLSAGNGATQADIGKFWFVTGYSLVGGPDVIPET